MCTCPSALTLISRTERNVRLYKCFACLKVSGVWDQGLFILIGTVSQDFGMDLLGPLYFFTMRCYLQRFFENVTSIN